MIACYYYDSVGTQNLERQQTEAAEYAQSRLNADLSDMKCYQDTSTGTDTNHDAYHRMMADLEAGMIDVIVVNSISYIPVSIGTLGRTAKRIRDAGAELHSINEEITIKPDQDDPHQQAILRLLEVFAELKMDVIKMPSREDIVPRPMNEEYQYGPAPLGFEKDSGHLVEGSNYHRVCVVLEMVMEDELSKRKAAKELGTSRATIDRALDRTKLYDL